MRVVSVIIPVLNEVALVGRALEALLRQSGAYEVIVADGGSADGTCEVVRRYPVQLVQQPEAEPPGIGSQIKLLIGLAAVTNEQPWYYVLMVLLNLALFAIGAAGQIAVDRSRQWHIAWLRAGPTLTGIE